MFGHRSADFCEQVARFFVLFDPFQNPRAVERRQRAFIDRDLTFVGQPKRHDALVLVEGQNLTLLVATGGELPFPHLVVGGGGVGQRANGEEDEE